MRCVERCPQCPSRGSELGQKPVVSGDWNDGPFRVLFVGEAPGREENSRRRVFVGRTGEEFNNTYLPLAGLSRSEVSMTNSVKCHWADSSDAPPDELVKSCSEFHLRRELEYNKPDYVVLMGATANSLLGLDVEMEHGMPHHGSLLGWTGPIFSTFHPALGLHKSDKMLAMVDKLDGDFPRLKLWLRGQLPALVDKYPDPEFTKLTDPRKVRSVMQHYLPFGEIAVDTEAKKNWKGYHATIKYTPWCATFCIEPGSAYMVRCCDTEAYRAFGDGLRRYRKIIFHNSAFDHEILLTTGIDIPWSKVQCTMAMAYDDGRVPKGLKAQTYRLRGKRMRSFDDVVIPHSRMKALEYYELAMSRTWPKPVHEPTGDIVTKKCPECKGTTVLSLGRGNAKRLYECDDCQGGYINVPRMTRKQSLNDKLWRLATDMRKNPHGIDLWERWDGWAEKDPMGIEVMIKEIGPVPLPSIEYVPENEAIDYACSDAHETRCNFPIMKQRLIDLRRSVQHE